MTSFKGTIAKESSAHKIAQAILKSRLDCFQVIVIRDPFRPGFHLALIGAKEATKGTIVEKSRIDRLPLIVAGDDYNDVHMLKKADIKIVMGSAPQDMHALGDIVAPPVTEQGILSALEEALKSIKE